MLAVAYPINANCLYLAHFATPNFETFSRWLIWIDCATVADNASTTETLDWGSIRSRVKPNNFEIGVFCFLFDVQP